MSLDIYAKRKIDEVEENLLVHRDDVERLHLWFSFAKSFSAESHSLYEAQYMELIGLCKKYTETPDPTARKGLKKQIVACSKEIENLNAQLKRLPRIQSKLEQAILGTEENNGGEKI